MIRPVSSRLLSLMLYLAILVVGTGYSVSAFADFVGVEPSVVDFGNVSVGSGPTPRLIEIKAANNGYAKLKSLKWKSGTAPSEVSFSPPLVIGDVFNHTAKTISVVLAPTVSKYLNDELELVFICADGDACKESLGEEQKVNLSIIAKIDCFASDPDCAPKGPDCRIDFNTVSHVYFPTKNLKKEVSPAVLSVHQLHNSGYKTYELPLNVIWSLAGLSDLFDPIGPACCDCSNTCPPNIKLTHLATSKLAASFVWNSPDGKPISLKTKSNPLFDAELSIPAKIEGVAIVGGSYVELWYSSVQTSPQLMLKYVGPSGDYLSGTSLYEGQLLCTGTTTEFATIKHPDPATEVPRLNLYAADKPPY